MSSESTASVLHRAARAVARIDLEGGRGITLVSMRDIEAMALALVILGLPRADTFTSTSTSSTEGEKT